MIGRSVPQALTPSTGPKDLDEYARSIVIRDRTLTGRDIALIYALGRKDSSVSFDTPKQFVFSSFLNKERVEVREESSASNDNENRDLPL